MNDKSSNLNYCPTCGTKLTDQPNFCPKCGKNLLEASFSDNKNNISSIVEDKKSIAELMDERNTNFKHSPSKKRNNSSGNVSKAQLIFAAIFVFTILFLFAKNIKVSSDYSNANKTPNTNENEITVENKSGGLENLPLSNSEPSQNTESQNYQIEKKPKLLITSKRVVFAGIKDDIYLSTNGPMYYCEGTVLNSGNADAHNVKLIFRNSDVVTIYLGTIQSNSTKDFKTDYFSGNHSRGYDYDNVNRDLSNYFDLSAPDFSCTELGGFSWER